MLLQTWPREAGRCPRTGRAVLRQGGRPCPTRGVADGRELLHERLAKLAREQQSDAEAEALARVGRQEGGEEREHREQHGGHEQVVAVEEALLSYDLQLVRDDRPRLVRAAGVGVRRSVTLDSLNLRRSVYVTWK